jgi:hypothetical protein
MKTFIEEYAKEKGQFEIEVAMNIAGYGIETQPNIVSTMYAQIQHNLDIEKRKLITAELMHFFISPKKRWDVADFLKKEELEKQNMTIKNRGLEFTVEAKGKDGFYTKFYKSCKVDGKEIEPFRRGIIESIIKLPKKIDLKLDIYTSTVCFILKSEYSKKEFKFDLHEDDISVNKHGFDVKEGLNKIINAVELVEDWASNIKESRTFKSITL